jgi:hypothetical protein
MPVLHFFATRRNWTTMTPTTTLVSGPNTEDSLRRAESALGEAQNLLADDPYFPVCLALWRLLSRKRGYYGCAEESPLENALGVQDEGIEPWVYQLARIGEKCRRLRGMIDSDRTLAIRETLADIAGHAIVAIALNDALGEAHGEPEGR